MKKKVLLLLAAAMVSVGLTGCVKIIDKGTEAQYTGVEEFDAAADSGSDWSGIVEELTNNAVDIVELVKGDGVGKLAAVSGTVEVKEFESKANGKKNALIVDVEGYSGSVKIQIGSIYSGTDIRDIQTVKVFEDFTNQTEWSQYAKALNAEVDTQVVVPAGLDDGVVGKKVAFVGAASESGDEITITPVSITVE